MTLDILKSVNIIEVMENYISNARPPIDIRPQLDLGYEIDRQSIILNENRAYWKNPNEIKTTGYAKATFVKDKNIWKIYWKQADNKWHSYKPNPIVSELKDFLQLVDEDKYKCFKG